MNNEDVDDTSLKTIKPSLILVRIRCVCNSVGNTHAENVRCNTSRNGNGHTIKSLPKYIGRFECVPGTVQSSTTHRNSKQATIGCGRLDRRVATTHLLHSIHILWPMLGQAHSIRGFAFLFLARLPFQRIALQCNCNVHSENTEKRMRRS